MKFCIYFYHRHTLNTKSHTHVKKMGHTSEFHFGIYWWTLKNLKNQNFEKMKKNCWRYHHFTHVYQKPQSYKVQFLRYGLNFFVILGHFMLYPFTHVQHKSKSYDVWFLRYKVQRTTLAATLLTIQKNKILKK